MNVGIIERDTPRSGRTLAASTAWQAVGDVYLDTLDSPSTRRAYTWHITDALASMGVATLADLTGADLTANRAAVVASTGHSPSTHAQCLAAVRPFLAWVGSMGAHRLPGDVIRLAMRTPRTSVRRPHVTLSDPEVIALVTAAETDRDRAILGVLLGAGLHVSEWCGLDVSDLIEDDADGAALYVRRGKDAKNRTVGAAGSRRSHPPLPGRDRPPHG